MCFRYLVMVLAVLFSWPSLEGTAVAAPSSDARRPNILFAIADDWGLHAGAYGTKWVKTPNFDRVAREGVLFQRAYTPVAKCSPSRAAILTGRNPWLLKAAANHFCEFPAEYKTWCEALNEQGWFVGHTVKGWGPGVALNAQGQPRKMTGRGFNARRAEPPTSEIGKSDYAANFQDFLAEAPQDTPWCFWYGCIEPHRKYEYASGVNQGGKQLTDIERVPGYWTDNETVRNDMLDYAYEVEHFDTHLGRMLKQLEVSGELANTLVVVTSDHGMPFPRVKGHAYEFANHIPLAMMWPTGIAQPGRVVEDYVSNIDLAPTFMDLAQLPWSQTGMAPATGASLTPILYSEKSGTVLPERDHVLIGKERNDVGRPMDWGYPTRGIIKDNWLYLKNYEPARWPGGNPETGYTDSDSGATKSWILQAHRENPNHPAWAYCFGLRPAEELYDLSTDPDCLKNLALDATTTARLATLSSNMTQQLTDQGDPRALGQGQIFDTFKQSNPAMSNFYEMFLRGENIKPGWIEPNDIDPLPESPLSK